MQVAPAGFVLTVLLALGARAAYWDYAAIPADYYQVDPRRTKVSLHLDKSNENDVEFVHDVADVLKKYRDVKLETENVALRNQPSREEDPAKDPGRTKVSLHLDKSNENDVGFVHDIADVLKKYRDVKLETENVALRNQASREEDAAKVLADKIVQVLVENPKSNVVAIRARVEPKHENDVVSGEAPEANPVAQQEHAGRCRYY